MMTNYHSNQPTLFEKPKPNFPAASAELDRALAEGSDEEVIAAWDAWYNAAIADLRKMIFGGSDGE